MNYGIFGLIIFITTVFIIFQNVTLAETEPKIFALDIDEQMFKIPYKITNAEVTVIEVDPDFTSMIAQIDGDAGEIEITVPRNLIDAKELESNEDDSFVVLVDGEEETYEEINNSPCFRTILIKFPKGANEIEIAAGYPYERPRTVVPPVFVAADKNNYELGETITVWGCTSLSSHDEKVVLEVVNPEEKVYRTMSVTPNIDGSFSTSLLLEGELAVSGAYTVKATYAGYTYIPEFPMSIVIASLAIGIVVTIMRLKSVRLFLH